VPGFQQQTCPIQNKNSKKRIQNKNIIEGRCAMASRDMARLDPGYLPRGNPCAQCGEPIARPDWVESSPGRTAYLWQCRACNYRFEAIAIYDQAQHQPLAA
jgi:hypothetical protein